MDHHHSTGIPIPVACRWASGLLAGLLALAAGRPTAADTFTETYYLATGGIASGDIAGNDFKDHSPGPDMLPYTDDDEELPPGGNTGGTWTFGALDVDGDGVPEHLFSCTRRDDDDELTLTSYSDFQHGVFAEGEDWIDVHEANNLGPSGDGTLGVDPGDDFEWNDDPDWEGQSNWFWYNNRAANQRGLGGSRYYFELRNPSAENPSVFDEVQQWVKHVNLQTNADDPRTDFNEESDNWSRNDQVVIKGLLIPVDAIPELKDGELDPLFGWYKGDMAKYVREVLGPKLEDPNLGIFLNDEGGNSCGRTRSLLPPTYLMIQQGEVHVTLNPGGEAAAAYWGITPINVGEPATDAVLRWCRIVLKGDDDTIEDGWNPPIQLVPDDNSRENLWRRDKFVRENINQFDPIAGTGTGLPDSWGALQLGCDPAVGTEDNTPPDHCWYFLRDNDAQGLPVIEDCQDDYVLTIPGGSGPDGSWFIMPITQALDAAKGQVRAQVQVRVADPNASANAIEIALIGGQPSGPLAWLKLNNGDIAQAGAGGQFGPGDSGPVVGGSAISQEAPVAISADSGVYTTFDLIFDAAAKKITVKRDGVELISGAYTGFDKSSVSALRVWTESGEGDNNQIYVNEVAVLQEFPHPFIRGEANCDGTTDISDAVTILNYLFTGGTAPCCLAAANVNGDGLLDISDPVALLSFLFTGGNAPPAPYPACGVDWDTAMSCDSFNGCP